MNLTTFILKLLSFSLKREDFLGFNNRHLTAGVIGTWVAGMGRYWDDPAASMLQHLGLGSVIYIFALALFIWLIILPFKVERWTYKTVLTFIALTSFPAILYAIPVERFLPVSAAYTMNVMFLAIVALWRLCLLYYFLQTFTRLSHGNIVTVTFMPICLIISVLTILNLHKAVFDVMGGMRDPSPNDSAYFALVLLTGLSMIFAIPLLIAYGVGIYLRHKK